jgi:O-acetylhomoserine/O-acetylserine sulfhydrylase
MIRISVGIEHIDDIIHDFEQSFAASDAVKAEGKAIPEHAKTTGGTETAAGLSGAT